VNRRDFMLSTTAAAAAAGLPLPAASAAPAAGPAFRLGAVTYNTLKDFDVPTIIRVLEGAGFEAVELRTSHKHGVEPSIGREERARVRELFEKSKVRLVSFGTTCRFQSPDPAERAKQLVIAKQFADLAHDTGAIGIKMQPMEFPAEVPVATTIQNFGASLRELGDYGSSRGVEIWVEVHGRASEPAVAAALMKASGHKNVGVCWNSNPADVVNGSVKPSFDLLKPWIRSVHINELANDHYPWRELFALLRDAGYDRYTFAEVQESKEPERFLRGYRALWTEMNRSCA
jgi:sugar phosphate isomerase/epimerase